MQNTRKQDVRRKTRNKGLVIVCLLSVLILAIIGSVSASTQYNEAPELAELVAAGTLPPPVIPDMVTRILLLPLNLS